MMQTQVWLPGSGFEHLGHFPQLTRATRNAQLQQISKSAVETQIKKFLGFALRGYRVHHLDQLFFNLVNDGDESLVK